MNWYFARGPGGEHKITCAMVQGAFGVEFIQDFLLKRVGSDFEKGGDGAAGSGLVAGVPRGPHALLGQGALESISIPVHIVQVEFVVGPVGVEGFAEFVDDVGHLPRGDFHVPLQAVGQGRAREVGRANVAGVEAAVAQEQVGFGVEAFVFGVVGDLDLGVGQAGEYVDGFGVGGAHVGGGDDAQVAATGEFAQGRHQGADAGEF